MRGSYGQYDAIFKILLIGRSSVGKTSIIKKYTDDNFSDKYNPTVGVDLKLKTLEIKQKIIKLQIFDTAGQEKFKSIISAYYKGSHGIVIVYDVTSRESFNEVQFWYNEALNQAAKNVSLLLVGNKIDCDAERVISYDEGLQLATQLKMSYLETSAKYNNNIDAVFDQIIESIYNSYPFDNPYVNNQLRTSNTARAQSVQIQFEQENKSEQENLQNDKKKKKKSSCC